MYIITTKIRGSFWDLLCSSAPAAVRLFTLVWRTARFAGNCLARHHTFSEEHGR